MKTDEIDKSTKFYLINGDKKICWGYSIKGVENNRKKRISYFKQRIKYNETVIARLKHILNDLDAYNAKSKMPLTADTINSWIEQRKGAIERMNKYADMLANAKIVPDKSNNTMPFEQALVLLKQGQKVRRKAWPNYYYIYLTVDNDDIRIHDKTCSRDFTATAYELLHDDWEVVPVDIEDLVPDSELPIPFRKEKKTI